MAADHEGRVVYHRQLDHRDAVFSACLRSVAVHWLAGRDEEHRREAQLVARLLGDGEMAVVDGIEQAAEDAPARRTHGLARCLAQASASHSSSTAPMRTVSPVVT